ncbi:fimbrial protein [Chromobacterium sp. IIBBL 290-4]|uniref:fimbrial protein n=1 Tax=Chromobacterium sp. IIBBL 290-4 TaxID=2953890 RepID=UPI0020B73661|nr:fimbrial protein [Chromobacterium sp. IIBBL 290-4]UTH74787.1 fimbrial protein [Chromobacterium sp. IIBBL 290-4]
MKQIVIAALIGLGVSSAAMASDGLITITGKIAAQTCTITGTTGTNVSVPLPTVGASALTTSGATAGATPFNIRLTSCPSGLNNAQTRFEVGSTIDSQTGNLLNAVGTGNATNVEVQVLNSSFAPINLSSNVGSQSVSINNGTATLNYYAQYYATGAATAGLVNSSVQYSMTYQ